MGSNIPYGKQEVEIIRQALEIRYPKELEKYYHKKKKLEEKLFRLNSKIDTLSRKIRDRNAPLPNHSTAPSFTMYNGIGGQGYTVASAELNEAFGSHSIGRNNGRVNWF
jgi:hypothetical protein